MHVSTLPRATATTHCRWRQRRPARVPDTRAWKGYTSKLKAIIWDFDGTLGYREGGWTGTLLDIARRTAPGCDLTAEQIRPHLQAGFPWQAPEQPHLELRSAEQWWQAVAPVLRRAFEKAGFGSAQAQAMAGQVRESYLDPARWHLYDDTLPALQELSCEGWTHVILSNHVPELREIAQRLGLNGLIDRIFNSAEMGYEKPHPQAFRQALQALDGATTVWMVGDNPNADVGGAEALGIPAILVRKQDARVRYCCADLAQVTAILRLSWPALQHTTYPNLFEEL